MPAGANEHQLSCDPAVGFRKGLAIIVGLMVAIISTLAWLPGVVPRVLSEHMQSGVIGGATGFVAVLVPGMWRAYQRCTVYLTPDGLRIVRRKHEILVPLSQIAEVKRHALITIGQRRLSTIDVTFREPTPLGTSIQFSAPDVNARSVIEELRTCAGLATYS